jgi:uncharacterized protein (TIGR02145 family)
MNKLVKYTGLVFLIIVGILHSCKKEEIPTLTTAEITSITATSAISGGNIIYDGGALVSERGVCWSTNISPTISNNKTSDGAGGGSFSSSIYNLSGDTKYYIRAYATNIAGTGYGNQVSFTTMPLITFNPNLTYGSFSDIEGNIYRTIQIGAQIWMAENLKTTKFYDGAAIPLVTDYVNWVLLSTAGYCWYDNDQAKYKDSYGAIYNWYAVSTGKLCPTGWHVPSDSEWTTLTTYLNGESVAGDKLKEASTIHWLSSNIVPTNESGFTALPGGYRSYDGVFDAITGYGSWWSSTEVSATDAYSRYLNYNSSNVGRYYYEKVNGFSVRCLKD